MTEPYIIQHKYGEGNQNNSDPVYSAFWNRTQDKDALIRLILGHVEEDM